MPATPHDRRQLYLPLLAATVEHAVENTAYYAEAYKDYGGRISTLDQFTDLPILSREIVCERGDHMLSRQQTPDFLRNTSGSTFSSLGRKPMVTFHTRDEARFAEALEARRIRNRDHVQPLMLRLLSVDHGVDVTDCVPGVFAVPMANRSHFQHITELLDRSFSFSGFSSRVEGVVGTLSRLKILTVLCLQEEIRVDNFNVRFLGCHSQFLTDRWRRLVRSVWNAELTELYGISEIPGLIGPRCEACAHYHLSPKAFVETVDTVTYKPVESGLARVVATGLYPLLQAQPLIRYDTEDFVEVFPPCPVTGQQGVEYVGRADDVATMRPADRSILLLAPAHVHPVLDEDPAVGVAPSPLGAPFGLSDEVGSPHYLLRHRVQDEITHIELHVALRWDPRLYPEEAHALGKRLRARLEATSVELGSACRAGLATLDIRLGRQTPLGKFTDG